MANDASLGKLDINPRFVPYIEKFRIYDLIYDISTAVAINKPKDHILFIRNYLCDMKETRDKPRILLVVPPHMDGLALAQIIADTLRLHVIRFVDLLAQTEDKSQVNPCQLADRLVLYIQKKKDAKAGWITYEFPRDYIEAATLQKHAIYPSHTLEIIPNRKKYKMDDAWFEPLEGWTEEKFKKAMAEYKLRVLGLRKAFCTTLKQIPVSGQNLQQLAKQCIFHAKQPVYRGAPMLPRVVLIGTRGSRRRTIAKMLKAKYNMVHIDMEELILQGKKMEDNTGKRLREMEKREVPIYAEVVLGMIQRRLLQRDCINRGWILTGFPRDVADFRALDDFDTPPNKVIFLSVSQQEALKHLKRKVNVYTGHLLTEEELANDSDENPKEYLTHPRDIKKNVLPEQRKHSECMEDMLKYCGENCNIIDGHGPINEVFERISRLIFEPGPIAPPRQVKSKKDDSKHEGAIDFVLKELSCVSIYPNVLTDEFKVEITEYAPLKDEK